MSATKLFKLCALMVVLVLGLAACGGGEEASSDAETSAAGGAAVSEDMASEPVTMESETASESTMGESEMGSESMAASDCELEPLPEEGDGSVDTMAEQPAATAASGNPNLSTLVTAVEEAGLVDTLNGEGPFTIFAPANCAFEDIPEEDLNALLEDTEQLTQVLTFHVVSGEALSSDDLVGMDSVTSVEGSDISLSSDSGMLEVNGQAQVVAADVQVGNGVVHVIDTVLMPSS